MAGNEMLAELEKQYPRVAAQVAALWEDPEFAQYLNSLLTFDDGRMHEGFPDEVLEELRFLQDFYYRTHPQRKPDTWGSAWKDGEPDKHRFD